MTLSEKARPAEILLVEDSETDVLLMREALRAARVLNTLHVANDGVAALDFVHRRGRFAEAPRPDLILLDLNLPRMNGREVLEALKADSSLRTIPVIVLTSSRAESDVLASYQRHVNCYVVKPLDFDEFTKVLGVLEIFWLQIVTLPPASP